MREQGQWYEEQSAVKEKVRDFFKQSFEGEPSTRVRLDNTSTLSEEDNVMLVGRITKEKIKHVVWCCGSDKSPGPDDFNFRFLKFC